MINEHDIFDAIGGVGGDLIERAGARAAKVRRRRVLIPLLAACLAIVTVLGFAAFAAERAEYGRAVTFFAENDLPADGLTRDEVRSVYKDITSGAFADPKTAEVLSRLSLDRYFTELLSTDQESLKTLWNTHQTYLEPLADPSSRFSYELRYSDDANYLICLKDGSAIWEKQFPLTTKLKLIPLKTGVLAYGYDSERNSSSWMDSIKPRTGVAVKFNTEGDELWRHETPNTTYDAVAVSYNELVFFGYRDTYGEIPEEERDPMIHDDEGIFITIDVKLCFTRMDLDGEISEEKPIDFIDGRLSRLGIDKALKTSAGYFLLYGDGKLLQLTHGGEIVEVKSYQNRYGESYFVSDMLYRNGKLWLSVHEHDADNYASYKALKDKIFPITSAYYKKWRELGQEPPFEGEQRIEFTNRFVEIFQSAFLVCDESGNSPKELISFSGLPDVAGLRIDASGNICWRVNRLDSAKPGNPEAADRLIYAELTGYEFSFDRDGNLRDSSVIGTSTQVVKY